MIEVLSKTLYICREIYFMSTRDLHILDEIKNRIRLVQPDAQIILFGSRARGDANLNSDWDILVLLKKSTNSKSVFEKITYPLYEYGWSVGELISTKVYTIEEWAKRHHTLFYKNVQNEGIIL